MAPSIRCVAFDALRVPQHLWIESRCRSVSIDEKSGLTASRFIWADIGEGQSGGGSATLDDGVLAVACIRIASIERLRTG